MKRLDSRIATAIAVVAFAGGGVAGATERPAHDAITNYDVIELTKAGLSEDVVLNKIAASEVDFDTSTDAILGLKRAGVSDTVIAAMIVRETGTPPDRGGADGPSTLAGGPLPVRLEADGQTTTLEAQVARDRYVNAVVALLWFKRLKGEQAKIVIHDTRPRLRLPATAGGVAINLDGLFLVKFDIDRDDEVRDYRLDWGTPFKFVVDTVPEDDYLVEYESESDGSFIVVSPRRPLKKGEYGLVDQNQFVYDFSVRP